MKLVKKIILGFIILLVFFSLFSVWYKYTYKMDVIESYEINSSSLSKKVLIASQGSEFKNTVVTGVIDRFKSNDVYFKVIDINLLKSINSNKWNAIIILHTWEMWKPPTEVKDFIDNNMNNLEKIIVVSTSGDGSFKIEGVDAFTGESIMEKVPTFIEKISNKLTPLLTK